MRTSVCLAVAVLVTALSGAAAQQKAPGDGTVRAVSTQRFVQLATAANRFEIDSSELAVAKANDERVKQFARMMLEDHKAADSDIASRAKTAGVGSDKVSLEQADAATLDKLGKASGAEFDRAYARAQLDAHTKAVALFTSYADAGEDVGLRGLAQKLLPTLEHHLEAARTLDQETKGAS